MWKCDEGFWNNSRKTRSQDLTNLLLKKTFAECKEQKRPALLSYTVLGDPSLNQSIKILNSISNNVDILEVGIPFNCPIGDGPAIQDSSYRSLSNGFKNKDLFKSIKKFKNKNKEKPVILMLYYQTVFQYGENKFIKDCKKNLVSGLIIVDYPYPLNQKFAEKCKKNSICFVQLVSPTTKLSRLKNIIINSHEIVYMISMLSTTGGKLKVSPKDILKRYNLIRSFDRSKYYVIGFGITENNISSLKSAQGLVCGSNLCRKITESLKKNLNPAKNLYKLTLNLKNKIT